MLNPHTQIESEPGESGKRRCAGLARHAGVRAGARGFTLLELLAVVSIISVLAATALPGIANQLRDRRGNEVAQGMSVFFRTARARAMGRGAAQLVRFRAGGGVPQGELLMYEAVQPFAAAGGLGNCGFLPPSGASSCITTVWPPSTDNGSASAPTATSRFVANWGQTQSYKEIFATFNAGANVLNPADVCFTPTGRTYFGATGTPLVPLLSVLTMNVNRMAGTPVAPVGVQRQVLIPPNGAPRLRL